MALAGYIQVKATKHLGPTQHTTPTRSSFSLATTALCEHKLGFEEL